jgi:thiol-disulfide isomerase/thioredoxin
MQKYLKFAIGALLSLVVIWGIFSVANAPVQTATPLDLTAYIGKPLMIEFALTTCLHCQNMAPIVGSEYSKWGGSVIFLTIFNDSPSDIQAFVTQYHVIWVTLADQNGATFSKYGVTGTPTFIFINSADKVVSSLVGEQTMLELDSAFNAVA